MESKVLSVLLLGTLCSVYSWTILPNTPGYTQVETGDAYAVGPDWSTIHSSGYVPYLVSKSDMLESQGLTMTKGDLSDSESWQWSSNVDSTGSLLGTYLAAFSDSYTTTFIFGIERTDFSGEDAEISITLAQDTIVPKEGGGFEGKLQDGDLLIKIAVTENLTTMSINAMDDGKFTTLFTESQTCGNVSDANSTGCITVNKKEVPSVLMNHTHHKHKVLKKHHHIQGKGHIARLFPKKHRPHLRPPPKRQNDEYSYHCYNSVIVEHSRGDSASRRKVSKDFISGSFDTCSLVFQCASSEGGGAFAYLMNGGSSTLWHISVFAQNATNNNKNKNNDGQYDYKNMGNAILTADYLYPYQVIIIPYTGAEIFVAIASSDTSGSPIDIMVNSASAFNVSYCTTIPPPELTVTKACKAVGISADGTQVEYQVSVNVTNSNVTDVTSLAYYSNQMHDFTLPDSLAAGGSITATASVFSDQWPFVSESDTVTGAYDQNRKSISVWTEQVTCETSDVYINALATLGTVCEADSGAATFVLHDTLCNQGNVAAIFSVGDSYGNTHGQVTLQAGLCVNLTSPVESLYTASIGFVTTSGLTLIGSLPISLTAPYSCTVV